MNYKHGYCKNRNKPQEWQCWVSMKQRCYKPYVERYPHYGGRGIKVCDRWLNSFSNFILDMGLKPTPQHQIDRIDVNGNYTPKNCRWATRSEQARNTVKTYRINYNNETLTLRGWADRLGIKRTTLSQRILVYKWPIKKAFTTPVKSPPRITHRLDGHGY